MALKTGRRLFSSWHIFAGCELGPRAISDGREKFNRAVGDSQSSMLLLNLVKMRYRDRPSFLQITSISSNPQFSGTMGLNFRAGRSSQQTVNRKPGAFEFGWHLF